MTNSIPEKTIVLAVGAHPDDIEGFAGGTLALLARRGVEVHFCIATGGEAGITGDSAQAARARRFEEARTAAAVLGARSLSWLGAGDATLEANLENRLKLVAIIRRLGANLLIGHAPQDYHPDHRAASALVVDARMLSAFPNVGEGSPLDTPPDLVIMDNETGTGPDPHIWIDIDEAIEVRREAMLCHQSQDSPTERGAIAEAVDALARLRGQQRGGCRYAEGFRGCGTTPSPDGGIRRLITLLAA